MVQEVNPKTTLVEIQSNRHQLDTKNRTQMEAQRSKRWTALVIKLLPSSKFPLFAHSWKNGAELFNYFSFAN